MVHSLHRVEVLLLASSSPPPPDRTLSRYLARVARFGVRGPERPRAGGWPQLGLGLLVERDGGGHEGRHQQPQREDGPQGRGGGLQRPPVAKYT